MKKLLTALLITASATAMATDAEIKSKLQALGAKNIEVKVYAAIAVIFNKFFIEITSFE